VLIKRERWWRASDKRREGRNSTLNLHRNKQLGEKRLGEEGDIKAIRISRERENDKRKIESDP